MPDPAFSSFKRSVLGELGLTETVVLNLNNGTNPRKAATGTSGLVAMGRLQYFHDISLLHR